MKPPLSNTWLSPVESEDPRSGQPLVEFLTPSQVCSYTPPPGAMLVGDYHIVKGAVFVIGGAPGVGKSRAGVSLARSGALAVPWFGLPVHRKFKTMILQNENGQMRLKGEFSSFNEPSLEEWIRISPPPPSGFCFQREDFRAALAESIAAFLPDVLLVDPWNAASKRDKAEDYLETFELIKTVLPTGNDSPAVGIVAHTRKPRADERASGRALLNLLAGSYVLSSVPRSAWVMQAASDETTDGRIVWTCCKNNDGEMGERTAWERANGAFKPLTSFDWKAFDRDGGDKLSWRDLPEIIAANGGPATKQQLVKLLETRGANQKSAYRWVDQAADNGLIRFDEARALYS